MNIRAALERVNTTLLIALAIVPAFHSSLLVFTFRNTYDAFVHIFFADHYARAWFDHWEYRWYTGFTMTSYPPGSHQSTALLSYIFSIETAFVIIFSLGIMNFVLGTYRSSRIWVSEKAAGYAAIFAVLASGVTLTVHVFGQLPTIFSLGFLLNALPFIYRWCKYGRKRTLLAALLMVAATTAGHHVTTLFGAVFIIGPVIVVALLDNLKDPKDYVPTQWRQRGAWRAKIKDLIVDAWPTVLRAGIFATGLVILLLVVVFPYWAWSSSDPITQVSIPHASRDSFIENPAAGLIFWIIPYGITLICLPYVFRKSVLNKRNWPLGLSMAFMFLLGTGGTTPIPRLILRGAFDILTLDRFTFWTAVLSLPMLGEMARSVREGNLRRFMIKNLGVAPWVAVQVTFLIGMILSSIFVATLSTYRTFQPAPIDMQPIVRFLNKDQHWRWRYLTLGFGDQIAWLATQTEATSVDGNYHSARRLPELTTTPVERLEGSKFRGIPGIGSLQQFLTVPDKYNLKYVFSNDEFYDPILYFSGWHRLGRLENGIMVWERADIAPLPDVLPRKEIPYWQRLMWGILPMTALIAGVITMLVNGIWKARNTQHWHASDAPPVHESNEIDFKEVAFNARALRIGFLSIVGIASFFGTQRYLQREFSTPEAEIIRYYDHLDFRRFEDAYEQLDPALELSFDEYIGQLSDTGGLLASYAKLDRIDVTVLYAEENFVELAAHTQWVTTLDSYNTTQTHRMHLREDGNWYLEPDQAALDIPPDTFFRQPSVDWGQQAIANPGPGAQEFPSIPDRPELEFLSAKLVLVDGRYSLVGEIINVDSDPADLTVTATIFDQFEKELSTYNAQDAIVHKILPKEVTPFRVDFEGVAGTNLSETDFSFDPLAFSNPNIVPAEIDAFEVYGKAVVTTQDLYRGLSVQSLQITTNGQDFFLRGELVNSGTVLATIPRLLISYYDGAGNVVWVGDVYIEQAVRPQYTHKFEIPLTSLDDVEIVLAEGGMFTNSLRPQTPVNAAQDGRTLRRIPAPAGSGFAELGVTVYTFTPEDG